MAPYLLTNMYTYTSTSAIPATTECLDYYKGVFVAKMTVSTAGSTQECLKIFEDDQMTVELVSEDLSLRVDPAVGAATMTLVV